MIKNLANHKILPAVLSVAMLSGFALTAFSNINQTVPKVNAVGACTLQSDALDNFDTPVYPKTIANDRANGINAVNNVIGSSFNGWTMQNGSSFNIVNVDGTGFSEGPANAQSGNQYVDVAGANDYPVNQFVLTKPGKITASAYFANRDGNPYNAVYESNGNISYQNWTGSIQILDSSYNTISVGNLLPFNINTNKDTWFKSEIVDFAIPTAGTYYLRAAVGDWGHMDTASYCLTENPTFGTTTATTVTPIIGTVGVSAFPTINMTGGNLPDNTVATFIPAGTTTVITGKIVSGNFVPDSGQLVPANATQGPTTGTLKSVGVSDVTVPTNFTTVAPTAANDNYTIVASAPLVLTPLTGDTGTGITVTKIGTTTLTPGIAQTGIVVPNGTVDVSATGVITFKASTGFVGTATIPYTITDSAGQTATANEVVVVSAALPTPPTAANDNYIANGLTPITITPLMGDTGTAIKVKSINGVVLTPGTAQNIVTPSGTFSITTAGVISYVADLSFTGTAAIPYIIEDSSAQTATANLIIAPSVPPTATNDNYTTIGTTAVTLTPLTGDTAGSTIKSINGVLLTPGTAQVIAVTGGNVNVGATGGIQFQPTAGFTGDSTFPYVITASNGVTASANVKVTVSAPIVSSSSLVASSSSATPASSSSLVASSSSLIASSSVLSSSSLAPIVSSSSVLASSSSLVASSSSLIASSSSIAMSSSSTLVSSSSATSVIAVVDNDNVLPTVEDAAPNTGDANKDGVKDSLQGNVASLVDTGATPKYVTVSADPTSPCQTLSNVSTNNEVANVVLDSTFDYPVGFVNFSSPCASSIKIKMYWYGLDTTKTYINRKFNAATGVYTDVAGITSSIETVNGSPVLTYTYTVTDNGPLDTNPAIGTITDPIGPVLAPVQTNGGGTIVITDGKVAPIASSTPAVTAIATNNPVKPGSTVANTASDVETTNTDSKGISTVRTGGSSLLILLLISISLVIGSIATIAEKQKSNNVKIR
jgi:large repetitive protein